MLARDYQEKRNFIRMQMDVPATITLQQTGQVIQARCLDLSGNGMLLSSPEAIAEESIFHIVISSTRPNLPPLEAEVRCTRCLKREDDFEIGVLIEDIN